MMSWLYFPNTIILIIKYINENCRTLNPLVNSHYYSFVYGNLVMINPWINRGLQEPEPELLPSAQNGSAIDLSDPQGILEISLPSGKLTV